MDLRINGRKLSYHVEGPADGLPVVFLHGFPFSHAMWQSQVSLLKDRYRIITYDHRGHGDSEPGDGQFMLEHLVDDFFALLDHLKVRQAVVCGLSMGGYIALRAIERSPDRFRALVLCDTRSEADSNEAKLKRAAGVSTIKTSGVPAFAEPFLKAIFAPETFTTQPSVVDFIRRIILANPPVGIAGTLMALASRTDTTASLSKIRVPTLLLVGEKDSVTPIEAAESMRSKISGAQMITIPQAGHMSNLENPAAFNPPLLDFLARLA